MKNSIKKLCLNKMTISNLNHSQMNEKAGGGGGTNNTFNTNEVKCLTGTILTLTICGKCVKK